MLRGDGVRKTSERVDKLRQIVARHEEVLDRLPRAISASTSMRAPGADTYTIPARVLTPFGQRVKSCSINPSSRRESVPTPQSRLLHGRVPLS